MVQLRFSRRAPLLVPIFEEQFCSANQQEKKHLQYICNNLLNMVTKTASENHYEQTLFLVTVPTQDQIKLEKYTGRDNDSVFHCATLAFSGDRALLRSIIRMHVQQRRPFIIPLVHFSANDDFMEMDSKGLFLSSKKKEIVFCCSGHPIM